MEESIMDFRTQSDIELGIARASELLGSNILWEDNKVYTQSILIEVLIILKDLLYHCEKLGKKIAFTDNVISDSNPRIKIVDVTDLIKNFRDAACHSETHRRNYGTIIFAFNTIKGKGGGIKVGDLIIENKYEDDIAYNMGDKILYQKRHIERAFQESREFLEALLSKNP